MFKSNNKGFTLGFDNGYRLSVQFGLGNYCDNREGTRETSKTAEIAVMDANLQFVGQELGIFTNGDDVEGWADTERVLEVMGLVGALPAK